jgi:hypothetical protein
MGKAFGALISLGVFGAILHFGGVEVSSWALPSCKSGTSSYDPVQCACGKQVMRQSIIAEKMMLAIALDDRKGVQSTGDELERGIVQCVTGRP